MPLGYQHIRCGKRQVKPEHYSLMYVLKSKYQISENMAQVAIIKVANYLFGPKQHGKWKPCKSDKPYDCNTLLLPSNTNRTELYIEAMIISNITEEIMNGDSQTVVTYSNDGPSLNCTGNFVVHSFNINGVQKNITNIRDFCRKKKISF